MLPFLQQEVAPSALVSPFYFFNSFWLTVWKEQRALSLRIWVLACSPARPPGRERMRPFRRDADLRRTSPLTPCSPSRNAAEGEAWGCAERGLGVHTGCEATPMTDTAMPNTSQSQPECPPGVGVSERAGPNATQAVTGNHRVSCSQCGQPTNPSAPSSTFSSLGQAGVDEDFPGFCQDNDRK